jgi:endonuclease/exonuclease/phosphatase family metal-dependent hydrolase
MRVWFFLTAALFAARCVDQVRPYWKVFVGAQDKPQATSTTLPAAASAPPRLRLASWNLEWLDTPGRGPNARQRRDYEGLAQYAAALDADVIAVQEVASDLALALVFPPDEYAFYLAKQGRSQRSGFVYRRTLPVMLHPDLDALAVEHELRAGADLGIKLEKGELRLLSIHLKAFCVEGPIDPKDRDCQRLGQQLPPLEGWIDARAAEGVPFVVLGDFNRTLRDKDDALYVELDDGEPAGLKLLRATPARPAACTRASKHLQAVDHVLLGGAAGGWLKPQSFTELKFAPQEPGREVNLGDHCPIALTVSVPRE